MPCHAAAPVTCTRWWPTVSRTWPSDARVIRPARAGSFNDLMTAAGASSISAPPLVFIVYDVSCSLDKSISRPHLIADRTGATSRIEGRLRGRTFVSSRRGKIELTLRRRLMDRKQAILPKIAHHKHVGVPQSYDSQ